MPGLLQVIVGPLYDALYSISAIERQRKKIVPEAQGVVLEIGIGEGLNLPWYDPAKVERVVGIDPDIDSMAKARRRCSRTPVRVDLVEASAEHIPFDRRSFDTVVLTYSSGAIADIASALVEMRRVLKPAGHLIFCDHGRSPRPRRGAAAGPHRPVVAADPRLAPQPRPCRAARRCGLPHRDARHLLCPAPRPKVLSFHYVGSAVLAG
jgi:SAM-dependent methyltransferase